MTYYKNIPALLSATFCALTLLPNSAAANSVKKAANQTPVPAKVISDKEFGLSLLDDDEIIVTASGQRQSIGESGHAITVITRDELENKQVAVLSDILREVPGVTIQRNGGVGALTSAFVRGGNSSQTLVLIDGVRINDPSTPNAVFDFGTLLTGNIDRVEILRGPNSVIWGSQAIGGIINIETAKPTAEFAVDAKAEAGSFDTYQGSANISGTSGIISGSVGGGYYHTNGISALSAGTERDGYESYSFNGKLKLELAENVSVDLRGYYNNGTTEFDDPFAFSPDTFPKTRTEQFIGYVGLNADFFDGRFQNRISYTRTDIDRIGSEPGGLTFNDNRLIGTIDRVEYHGAFDVAEDFATIIFGAEYERSEASTFFPAGGATAPTQADSDVFSLFSQLILKPTVGLTFTGGLRFDNYSLYGSEVTFGANAAYTPNDGNTLIRASYAEGFRAPTLTEAIPAFFGNPALDPETARNFDIGIEQHLLDRAVTARATYFNRRSTNQITFSFVSFLSENIERVNVDGVEVELEIRPNDRLTISGNYSFIDSENRSPGPQLGNRLARRPVDNANFSVDWETPVGLKLGGTISVTGDSFDDGNNATPLDGFVLAGIRASYPITDAVDVFGRVENLFDEEYETAAGFGSLGQAAYVGVRASF